eukprot:Hpha_TRINITY_DN16530_c0_g1::TRINITY_DN16530_c0_g1_i1::g.135564::m.135564
MLKNRPFSRVDAHVPPFFKPFHVVDRSVQKLFRDVPLSVGKNGSPCRCEVNRTADSTGGEGLCGQFGHGQGGVQRIVRGQRTLPVLCAQHLTWDGESYHTVCCQSRGDRVQSHISEGAHHHQDRPCALPGVVVNQLTGVPRLRGVVEQLLSLVQHQHRPPLLRLLEDLPDGALRVVALGEQLLHIDGVHTVTTFVAHRLGDETLAAATWTVQHEERVLLFEVTLRKAPHRVEVAFPLVQLDILLYLLARVGIQHAVLERLPRDLAVHRQVPVEENPELRLRSVDEVLHTQGGIVVALLSCHRIGDRSQDGVLDKPPGQLIVHGQRRPVHTFANLEVRRDVTFPNLTTHVVVRGLELDRQGYPAVHGLIHRLRLVGSQEKKPVVLLEFL